MEGLVENTAVASHTVNKLTIGTRFPSLSPGSGLNDAITFTTPNVAADSNGFFHPLGDHAQVSYVIDGQPISDQRNKVFSTSIPGNAIQSMELISGSPAAEYGDKTRLWWSMQTPDRGSDRDRLVHFSRTMAPLEPSEKKLLWARAPPTGET